MFGQHVNRCSIVGRTKTPFPYLLFPSQNVQPSNGDQYASYKSSRCSISGVKKTDARSSLFTPHLVPSLWMIGLTTSASYAPSWHI